MVSHLKPIIYRLWLRISSRGALNLLDIIKNNFYGYGYSLYSIQEEGLEDEYDFLIKRRLIELKRNVQTDKKTSIHPTKIGLEVGKTNEEKQRWEKIITKGLWAVISGVAITVIGGLILQQL